MLRYAVVCLFVAVLLGLGTAGADAARPAGVAQGLSFGFLALAAGVGAIGWSRRGRSR